MMGSLDTIATTNFLKPNPRETILLEAIFQGGCLFKQPPGIKVSICRMPLERIRESVVTGVASGVSGKGIWNRREIILQPGEIIRRPVRALCFTIHELYIIEM
jgi:hypothetical protein